MILIPFPQKSKDAKAFGASSQTATIPQICSSCACSSPVFRGCSRDCWRCYCVWGWWQFCSGAGGDQDSPLTYGKVFSMIPRMTKTINTPVINQRISEVFGVPALETSSEFKKIYSSGREALRWDFELLKLIEVNVTGNTPGIGKTIKQKGNL